MNTATRYPWRKFYPGQHLTDPRIMFLSLAARGLLVEVEALCYCAEPPGRLTMQGRAMTIAEVARLRGVDAGDVEKTLAELLAAGLLAQDVDGCIYSPALQTELDERGGTKRRVAKHRKNPAASGVTSAVTSALTSAVTPKSRVEKNRERVEHTTAAPSPPGDNAELFKAFSSVFKDRFGEDYTHTKGDFVQLAKWRKSHTTVAVEDFGAMCRQVWADKYHRKTWLTLRGICADWSSVVASLKLKHNATAEADHAAGF